MLKKIKRWLIIAGIAVAIFIPTYVAIISYNIINSTPPPIDADDYSVFISTGDGKKLSVKAEDEKEIKQIFLEMRRDAEICEDTDYEDGVPYFVRIVGENSKSYSFYIFSDARGYMLDGDTLYSLQKNDVIRFLNLGYSSAVFPNSNPPKLLSAGSNVISPNTAEWKYEAYRGKTVDADVAQQKDVVTYRHSGKIDLSFSIKPDECTVKVKRSDGSVLYEGDFFSYTGKTFDETHTLEYEIEAKWHGEGYSGSATYRFNATIGEPAEFEIYYGKYNDEYIEFVEIIGSNIGFTENVHVSVTPSTGSDPIFRTDGAYMRVLIPFGNDAKEGEYTVVATYGDLYGNLAKEFKFDYVKRNVADPDDKFYSAVDEATLEKYRKEYLEAIKEVSGINSDTVYMSGPFIDPDPDEGQSIYGECTINVGFGRTLFVKDSDISYKTDGVYYKTSGSIYALNGGRVVRVGENGWLGKYVVVDHGLGLKTWYCNLMNVNVNEGDTISANKLEQMPIGTAGNSGYALDGLYGFYLMTTIDGVPVSPYALFEDGVIVTKTYG